MKKSKNDREKHMTKVMNKNIKYKLLLNPKNILPRKHEEGHEKKKNSI